MKSESSLPLGAHSENPGSLRYEPSSFGKDHRTGFCPRPCRTSPCPGHTCRSAGGSSALGSFFPKRSTPAFSLLFLTSQGETRVGFAFAASKVRSSKARHQWEAPESRLGHAGCIKLAEPAQPCFSSWTCWNLPLLSARLLYVGTSSSSTKNKGTFPDILL